MGQLRAKVGASLHILATDRGTWLVALALLLWTIQAWFMVLRVDTWLDEGVYLIKSANYFSGRVAPYSLDDPTSYPPLYFLLLGTAQRIFGEGHLTGRLLSVVLSWSSLIFLYLAAFHCLRDKIAAGIATLVFALNPIAVGYMSTAAPYAFVTALSLISFLFVIRSETVPLLASAMIMGSLAAALFLTKINMVAALPVFAALYLVLQRDAFRSALLTLVGSVVVAGTWVAISIWYFGSGLVETLAFMPGLDRILWRWTDVGSQMRDVMTLTGSPNDLDIQWNALKEVVDRYLFQLYPTILAPTLLGTVLVFISRDRFSLTGFCALYFVVMTLVHLVGSQGYCPPCVMAYTNYYLAFAAIPAAFFLSAIAVRLPRHVTIVVFTIAAAVGTYYSGQKQNLGMLIPMAWDDPLKIEARLAESIKNFLPEGRILALSGSYQTFQAIWMAGGMVEPYSMSFLPIIREPRADLDPATKARAERALSLRGFRSSEGLIRDLRRPMPAVVVQERPPIFETLVPYVGAPNAQQIRNALVSGYDRVGEATEGDKSVSIWRPK
jgi:4-amino-4-deoxy-L-arabinose transferase-like glycosyltransferase